MAEPEREHPLIAEAKAQLGQFLALNPEASLARIEIDEETRIFVSDPWGDPSVAFILPKDYSAAASALNGVYLPSRYSALYHTAEKKLEIIWTTYKLGEDDAELMDREFDFTLGGATRKCGFGRSSDALLTIAPLLGVRMISNTEFRNLRSFASYVQSNGEADELGAFGEPISFWINDVEWDDDDILNLIRHINFYLRYYDSESPVIVVHPRKSQVEINPKTRYFEGFDGFPEHIISRGLDPNLLVLWGASFGATRSANFLNFYRIIEYVSFYHMHSEAFREIRDLIKKPHALADLERSTRDILLVLRTIKYQREQEAINTVIKDVVTPGLLWKEISQNRAFFEKATIFEGDLTIDALINEKATLEGFGKQGVERFATSVTKIRNALAHGKDISSHKTILPTSYNFDLLQPWLHLLAVAAGEVVLYEAAH
ncbi:MAG TPA: hypothetical protein VIA98_12550 [Allosphingosinicella sp.]|jgi:hypothetical protein